MRVSLVLGFAIAIQHVTTESLPACAQVCVGKTKTKCKSTDFACACSDDKYMPTLLNCIRSACSAEGQAEAKSFLSDLCLAFESPIVFSSPKHLELRADVAERQLETGFSSLLPILTIIEPPPDSSQIMIETFTQGLTEGLVTQTGVQSATNTGAPATTVRSTFTPTNTAPAKTTSPSSNNNSGSSSSGLSTGAKIGLGVGIPLGVIIIGGLVGIAFWMGRRSKQQKVTLGAEGEQNDGQEQKPPHITSLTGQGPVELDSTQYLGSELPTKGNTAEMEGHEPVGGYGNWGAGQQGVGSPIELPVRR